MVRNGDRPASVKTEWWVYTSECRPFQGYHNSTFRAPFRTPKVALQCVRCSPRICGYNEVLPMYFIYSNIVCTFIVTLNLENTIISVCCTFWANSCRAHAQSTLVIISTMFFSYSKNYTQNMLKTSCYHSQNVTQKKLVYIFSNKVESFRWFCTNNFY